jgi:valyl-tRNA synthetase
LAVATRTADKGLADFQLGSSTEAAHHFWLHELCAVFLEAIKV